MNHRSLLGGALAVTLSLAGCGKVQEKAAESGSDFTIAAAREGAKP